MQRCVISHLVIGIACLLVISPTPALAVSVDFERVEDSHALDDTDEPRAVLRGEARVSGDAHTGTAALALGGAAAKGVADFGADFGLDHEATISFWFKPAALSGIIVGKYGAINIEIVGRSGAVRFGLKLQSGWVHCQSPDKGVATGEWTQVTASWGPHGMCLSLDGEPVAHAALPDAFDWFIEDRPFLLGCYSWPAHYDSWCFEGLIDDFSYLPEQERPAGDLPAPPAPPAPVLERLLRDTPKPAYGIPLPATVRGRVVLDANGNAMADPDEIGAPNVSVSDGYSVARTDALGAYAITPSPSAVFIFITRPSGHDLAGHWYKPVTEQVDFTLKPSGGDETDFTFVQLTDAHVSTLRRSLEGLSEFVTEVNSLRPAPLFVFNSGDLVNLDKQLNASVETGHEYFRNYVGIMNHLTMPYRNVAGDHTDSRYRLEDFPPGDHRAGKALYWEYLGPNLFSFEYGRLHFVSIDSIYHMEDGTSQQVIPEHVAWLRQDLQSRTPGTISLTASEHHLEGYLPGFVELAGECDIRLQLVGDMHVVSEKQLPVPSRIHGALSGTWWNGPCADLSPQGYMIYHVQGESLECFYKGLGERVAIVSPGYGSLLSGQVTLQAHLVRPQDGEALEFSVAGGDWQHMTQVGRPFYRALYEATWDTNDLPDGLVEVSVRSMPDGETRTRMFVITNGKSSQASPVGATLTFSVGNVIGSALAPPAPVQVQVNGTAVGAIEAGHKGECSFQVPANVLSKVNVLTFDRAALDEPFTITHPSLTLGEKVIEDPTSAAVRQVQLNHWGEEVVSRAGFVIGDDPYETSFCMAQERFYFVLPDAPGE